MHIGSASHAMIEKQREVRYEQVKTIAIMNLKGGVGKTVTALNLADALRRAGRHVVLADCDGQMSLTRFYFPDLDPDNTATLAEYLRGVLNNGMGAGCFGKTELLVLAYRALQAAEELPEGLCAPPVPPPKAARRSRGDEVGPPASPASEAAQLKRATLERLTAYRQKDGLVSLGPLAALCGPAEGKPITPEMLGRMLSRERFPVAVWREVAAALDKMEAKKGDAENGKHDE